MYIKNVYIYMNTQRERYMYIYISYHIFIGRGLYVSGSGFRAWSYGVSLGAGCCEAHGWDELAPSCQDKGLMARHLAGALRSIRRMGRWI